MNQSLPQQSRAAIGPLQIAIIILVLITALIHLQRGIGMLSGGPGGGPPPGLSGPPPDVPPGGAPGGFAIMRWLPLPLPILFVLNGVGYLGLVSALYLPALARYRRLVRWVLIGFAAVTILMYALINGLRPNPIGLFDKGVEIALIVLLLIEDRRATRATAPATIPAPGA
jgi:hypothetical protein